jgi:8-oxo-dGTP pyrophosphatase MutT (NUDIX family)
VTGSGSWPPGGADRLAALAAGDLVPVPARPAATVLLLRDAPGAGPSLADGRSTGGPEVFMLRRQLSMAFAAGMHAFPGGRVDSGDARWPKAWSGRDAEEWGEVLGCGAELAAAVVCAAVREVFEECGVLFAGSEGAVVADTSAGDWEAERSALARHEATLAQVLDRRGLVLRTDLLHAWARWVTPETEPRRYDTWFFVAALPARGQARDLSGEADLVAWRRPVDVLADYRAGLVRMLPPTLVVLREIARHPDVASILAAARSRTVAPVTGRLPRQPAEPGAFEPEWPVDDPF